VRALLYGDVLMIVAWNAYLSGTGVAQQCWRPRQPWAAAALLDHSGQCPDILLVAGVYSVVHSGRTSLLQQVLYVVGSLSSFLCDDDAAADDILLGLPTGNQNM